MEVSEKPFVSQPPIRKTEQRPRLYVPLLSKAMLFFDGNSFLHLDETAIRFATPEETM